LGGGRERGKQQYTLIVAAQREREDGGSHNKHMHVSHVMLNCVYDVRLHKLMKLPAVKAEG